MRASEILRCVEMALRLAAGCAHARETRSRRTRKDAQGMKKETAMRQLRALRPLPTGERLSGSASCAQVDISTRPESLPSPAPPLRKTGRTRRTTLALVDPAAVVTAAILARHACRVAGGPVARAVFREVDPALEVELRMEDGQDAAAGAELLRVRGRCTAILAAERTALNFQQRMTGIATLVRTYVEAVAGTRCQILDTRKTVPGLRALDKYSVRCGGGVNHRMGLHDRVLIKDNHRRLWKGGDPGRLDQAIQAARARFPGLPVEVEVNPRGASQRTGGGARVDPARQHAPGAMREAVASWPPLRSRPPAASRAPLPASPRPVSTPSRSVPHAQRDPRGPSRSRSWATG